MSFIEALAVLSVVCVALAGWNYGKATLFGQDYEGYL